MEDLISKIRNIIYELNKGASEDELNLLAKELNCSLPEDLIALYLDHNGMPQNNNFGFPFRLLSVEEAIEINKVFEEFGWYVYGFRAFWTDDNSNYAGLFINSPLSGRICIIDHSEHDFSPVFRSIRSFLEKLLLAQAEELDWGNMLKDYDQSVSSTTSGEDQKNWKLAQALIRQSEQAEVEQEKQQFAFMAMALIPYEYTNEILKFLEVDDMYIQEKACIILGQRNYLPAKAKLAELTQKGLPNVRNAANYALGIIQNNK